MGELAADAGADLAGPRWREFFEYLDREAAPTLETMGRTLDQEPAFFLAAGAAGVLAGRMAAGSARWRREKGRS